MPSLPARLCPSLPDTPNNRTDLDHVGRWGGLDQTDDADEIGVPPTCIDHTMIEHNVISPGHREIRQVHNLCDNTRRAACHRQLGRAGPHHRMGRLPRQQTHCLAVGQTTTMWCDPVSEGRSSSQLLPFMPPDSRACIRTELFGTCRKLMLGRPWCGGQLMRTGRRVVS
jgi:hypothetical protein